jgi:hypothetical protein
LVRRPGSAIGSIGQGSIPAQRIVVGRSAGTFSLQLLHTRADRREIIGSTGSSQGALRILCASFLAGSMENYG